METITVQKIFEFDSLVESIDSIDVKDDGPYEILDENTYAKGKINMSGKVKTILGEKTFNEDVDVNIYAPFEKVIDPNEFKVKIKDFSYMTNIRSLIVYAVLEIYGIKEIDIKEKCIEKLTEEGKLPLDSKEELAKQMNNMNEIKVESAREETKEEPLEEVKEETIEKPVVEERKDTGTMKSDNSTTDAISNKWATDMFNLNDDLVLFMKIHKE